MKGCFSVAEVVDASNKKPEKTISCVLDEDQNDFWSKSQKGSFKAVMNMVKSNGAKMFTNLQNTLEFLNNK
jgi:uncharacterized protein YceK